MEEIQTNNPTFELIDSLAQFDPELNTRIDMIRTGFSPNGENPNGVLSHAIEGDDLAAQEKFIGEYSWALSLAIYPHRDKEQMDVLRSAAVDSLFLAGETYDPDQEPNFLKHLSATVPSYLAEVFGEVDTSELPSADEFQDFVLSDCPTEAMLIPPVIEDMPDETHSPEPQTDETVPSAEPVECPVMHQKISGPQKRLTAYRAGRLGRQQLTAWAAHFPEEVPMVNGELEWIALRLADLD